MKKVGEVTEKESKEIQMLFERLSGLQELAKIATVDNNDLYEKVIKDLADTNKKFQDWWNRMFEKYQWEGSENGHWEINFDTCEIYLVEE